MENYFKQMMSDGYELLIAKRVVWPGELTQAQKIELLQQAILYFEGIEEYQKCAILKTKIDNLLKKPVRRPRKKKGYDEKENSNWD